MREVNLSAKILVGDNVCPCLSYAISEPRQLAVLQVSGHHPECENVPQKWSADALISALLIKLHKALDERTELTTKLTEEKTELHDFFTKELGHPLYSLVSPLPSALSMVRDGLERMQKPGQFILRDLRSEIQSHLSKLEELKDAFFFLEEFAKDKMKLIG